MSRGQGEASNARSAAHRLLHLVLRRHRPLDEALDGVLAGLASRDRAFARSLTATSLRRLGEIDAVIDRCLDRPLPRSAAPARDALRLGVAQLLHLGVAPHAAVDGSVALLAPSSKFRGLVNAVLRRVARDGAALAEGIDPACVNLADWLWQSWCHAYGETAARAIGAAQLAEPPLDITVATDADAAGWAARLDAETLPTGSLRRRGGGAVEDLPGYGAGAWWVQDAAAALPAKLLDAGPGQTIYDLCAAPGGKTAQLAAAGAEVVAVDRSPKRLKRLRQNLARLGLTARCVEADAAAWQPEAPADAVLLDAPCSATGTIRRHPDITWLKSPDDVTRLVAVQARLLDAAIDLVRPGGLLVYCVCSLQPEEGPERIAAWLAGGAPFDRVAVTPEEVGGLGELLTAAGELRSLPSHLADRGGLDGFYACRLIRR